MDIASSFEQVKKDAEELTLKRIEESKANKAKQEAEDAALRARHDPAPAPAAPVKESK